MNCGRGTKTRAWIIPAGAGKSERLPRLPKPLQDHPRGCGEERLILSATSYHLGSSPRVRGRAAIHLAVLARAGIIPAGAGKSYRASWTDEELGDHPRGCGEEISVLGITFSHSGSSPRVRGRGTPLWARVVWCRIIPAGAGKSHIYYDQSAVFEDHPRGCGEESWTPNSAPPRSGSSPRVRGRVHRRALGLPRQGIIPAGAGKRS